jgi:hypothetical protein
LVTADDKSAFHWELVKLMLQVAWADDAVEPVERKIVEGLAERLSLPNENLEELRTCLDGRQSLPPPDMQLLRGYKEEATQLAEQLVIIDDEVTDDENRLLAELNEMLGATMAPPGPGASVAEPGGSEREPGAVVAEPGRSEREPGAGSGGNQDEG